MAKRRLPPAAPGPDERDVFGLVTYADMPRLNHPDLPPLPVDGRSTNGGFVFFDAVGVVDAAKALALTEAWLAKIARLPGMERVPEWCWSMVNQDHDRREAERAEQSRRAR